MKSRMVWSIWPCHSAFLQEFDENYVIITISLAGNFMVIGLRDAIIRKPLVCWMAARGNLEVLSNSAELDEAEESPLNGAARPKLVPLPILSHALSNSSGLLILNTDEAVRFCL